MGVSSPTKPPFVTTKVDREKVWTHGSRSRGGWGYEGGCLACPLLFMAVIAGPHPHIPHHYHNYSAADVSTPAARVLLRGWPQPHQRLPRNADPAR